MTYRVAGIENDDVVEFTGDGDVIGNDGTSALADWNDPQGLLTERQQGIERLGLWFACEEVIVWV